MEKLFWLADQHRPIHFAVAAEVSGTTRIEQWRSGLDRIGLDPSGSRRFEPAIVGSLPVAGTTRFRDAHATLPPRVTSMRLRRRMTARLLRLLSPIDVRARAFTRQLDSAKAPAGMAAIVDFAQDAVSRISPVPQASDLPAQAFGAEPMLTSLGTVDIPSRCGPLVLESLWGPFVLCNFVREQTAGAITFGGRLHTSHDPVDGLLDTVADLLHAALRKADDADPMAAGPTARRPAAPRLLWATPAPARMLASSLAAALLSFSLTWMFVML